MQPRTRNWDRLLWVSRDDSLAAKEKRDEALRETGWFEPFRGVLDAGYIKSRTIADYTLSI